MYTNQPLGIVLKTLLSDKTYKNIALKSEEGYKKILFTRDVRSDRIVLLVENGTVKEYFVG